MIKKVRSWLYKYRNHFWAWALFIFYECEVVRLLNTKPGQFWAYFIHYIIVIFFFYLHAHLSLPWALKKKAGSVWRISIIIIAELLAFVLFYYIGDVFLTYEHISLTNGLPHLDFIYIFRNIYREVYYLGYSSAYYFLTTFVKERRRAEAIERQRLNEIIKRQKIEQDLTRAQNAFLKAQINPHFLFNTLDFLYHNVMEQSPNAADAIIALSEMMRYAIDADKMGEFIHVGDEIEQVQNLQYLNRLRKNEDMPLKLIYSDAVRGISFIPLVLLTLTENMFKHGNLYKGQEATMEIYIENSLFIIKTDNVSNRQKPSTSHRTGLVNIEQRLKHAYGDNAYLDYYQDTDGHFRLIIKVPVEQLHGASAHLPVSANIGTV